MISGVILTKNSQEKIRMAIESMRFCREIIVVDDFSKDKTVKIARKLGARVYKRSLKNDFSSQRNFALSKAKFSWVFFMDSDECVGEKLGREIVERVGQEKMSGYFVYRKNYWHGKEVKYGEFGRTKLLRFAKRNAGRWKRRVHEYWEVNGECGELSNPLNHYLHKNVSEIVDVLNFQSGIHSRENIREKKQFFFIKAICFPPLKFIRNYFFWGGWRDGIHGFILAILMSFHSFLAWGESWRLRR